MILRAQIFISAVIRTTGSTQSMRETHYAEPKSFLEGVLSSSILRLLHN